MSGTNSPTERHLALAILDNMRFSVDAIGTLISTFCDTASGMLPPHLRIHRGALTIPDQNNLWLALRITQQDPREPLDNEPMFYLQAELTKALQKTKHILSDEPGFRHLGDVWKVQLLDSGDDGSTPLNFGTDFRLYHDTLKPAAAKASGIVLKQDFQDAARPCYTERHFSMMIDKVSHFPSRAAEAIITTFLESVSEAMRPHYRIQQAPVTVKTGNSIIVDYKVTNAAGNMPLDDSPMFYMQHTLLCAMDKTEIILSHDPALAKKMPEEWKYNIRMIEREDGQPLWGAGPPGLTRREQDIVRHKAVDFGNDLRLYYTAARNPRPALILPVQKPPKISDDFSERARPKKAKKEQKRVRKRKAQPGGP